jgi:uncharacterized membrane protein YqgA involved in biofilm formation
LAALAVIRSHLLQQVGAFTIGLQMALLYKVPLLFIGSLLIDGLIGETLRLEDRFTSGGEKLKRALKSGNPAFTEGLVAASLLFCIGSLAILGPFEEITMGSRADFVYEIHSRFLRIHRARRAVRFGRGLFRHGGFFCIRAFFLSARCG